MATNVPCSACSWTQERQEGCWYQSRVKLFYGVSDRGVWSIGSKLILKERSSKGANFEAANVEFIKEKTTIPVQTIIEAWSEDEDRYFLLARRVPGTTMCEAWPFLSEDDRERIAKQTADYLAQLRNLQSPMIESLGGKPVYDAFLFPGDYENPSGPLGSDKALWNKIASSIAHIPEKAQQYLKSRMPPAQPYTFSHRDLTDVNIMVDNGNLSGIIDWEAAGYYPVWWEYVGAGIGHGLQDKEWKNLLRKHMPKYDGAWEFYLDFLSLKRFPTLDERGSKLLERIEV
ncbi:MAG: hypothetical protein MMC23_004687 [Stictis urceolatum]|nr:hypothetical protein [Stictis urceolata]